MCVRERVHACVSVCLLCRHCVLSAYPQLPLTCDYVCGCFGGNFPGESRVLRVEGDGDRPVVDQGHGHHCAELARFNASGSLDLFTSTQQLGGRGGGRIRSNYTHLRCE